MFEALWLHPATAMLVGYLIGSIPFGVILTRLGGAGDLRQIGSGNIGATNVLRTGRKGLAALTLILDGAKGGLAYLIGERLAPGLGLHAATGAYFGHLFPVWLRFRGGKGVATLLGIVLAVAWPVGLVFALVWLAVLALTRYSSVAGMAAALATPVAAAVFGRLDVSILTLAFALITVWKHSANIGRLLSGSEPRVGSTG